MCKVWRIASLPWNNSFVRCVMFRVLISLVSPRNSIPVGAAPGTPHPRLMVIPSQTYDINWGRSLQMLIPSQRTWTFYHSSRKRQATVTTSSFLSQKRTWELPDLLESPLRDPLLASMARVVWLHLPVGPSMKGLNLRPRIAHRCADRNFGTLLM